VANVVVPYFNLAVMLGLAGIVPLTTLTKLITLMAAPAGSSRSLAITGVWTNVAAVVPPPVVAGRIGTAACEICWLLSSDVQLITTLAKPASVLPAPVRSEPLLRSQRSN